MSHAGRPLDSVYGNSNVSDISNAFNTSDNHMFDIQYITIDYLKVLGGICSKWGIKESKDDHLLQVQPRHAFPQLPWPCQGCQWLYTLKSELPPWPCHVTT